MNKKFYIFDMDGTLCDSNGWWRKASEGVTDFSSRESLEGIFRKMREYYRNGVELKDGVREFLEKSRAEGIKMCIATGTRRDIVEPFLRRSGIMEFMEFFIDCDEVGKTKGHPDIFLRSAERLGAEISECVVFEDTEHCAKTAKNAGFYVVGIIDEITSTEGDVRGYSDMIIEDWRGLDLSRV
ncbi:MAG: HAD family hydrolase [Ruminococcaceae bacterium]|nr:HAD family hydrolase [Oscillospiraceae bacterium]